MKDFKLFDDENGVGFAENDEKLDDEMTESVTFMDSPDETPPRFINKEGVIFE